MRLRPAKSTRGKPPHSLRQGYALQVTVPSLSFRVDREEASSACLAVGGEIDIATSPQLVSQARTVIDQTLIDQTLSLLTLDLSEVTTLDSSGIKALTAIYHYASARDCQLIVRNPQDIVQQVLEVARVGDYLTIRERDPDP
jgi:anti-anti-sigma factor